MGIKWEKGRRFEVERVVLRGLGGRVGRVFLGAVLAGGWFLRGERGVGFVEGR